MLEPEPGRYIPESAAILLYLAEGSEFLPEDRFERAQVHRWLFFEQTQVYPTMGALRFLVGTGRMNAEDTPKRPSVDALKLLEAHLAEHDFLVGDRYTLADLALFGYVHVAHEGGLEMHRFPAVQPALPCLGAPGNRLEVIHEPWLLGDPLEPLDLRRLRRPGRAALGAFAGGGQWLASTAAPGRVEGSDR